MKNTKLLKRLSLLLMVCLTLCLTVACGENGHVHSYTIKEVEASCANIGGTIHTCSCGKKLITNKVDAYPHDYGEDPDYDYFCHNCGQTNTRYFEFKLLEDDTYEVDLIEGIYVPLHISLPSIYNGKEVTTVASSAFYGYTITLLTIPDSITTIKPTAFAFCRDLTSVDFGDGVVDIESSAFYECTSLTGIEISDSVKTIGPSAFCKCTSLEAVALGKNVTTINSSAFESCENLKIILIQENLTSIKKSAFSRCFALQTIYYTGSEENWNAIEKTLNWDFNAGDYKIVYNCNLEDLMG